MIFQQATFNDIGRWTANMPVIFQSYPPIYTHDISLVGGWATLLKKQIVSWDDYSRYMEKLKMFRTTNQTTIYRG